MIIRPIIKALKPVGKPQPIWRDTQTVMTFSQLVNYKVNGFVQLDLFPEELEHAKHEQSVTDWSVITNLK